MHRCLALASVVLLTILFAAPVRADCDIRVMLSNIGTVPVEVRPPEFEVRSQSTMNFPIYIWGTWRRAQNGGLWRGRDSWIIQPGQVVRGQYLAQTLCSDAREIRFRLHCIEGRYTGESRGILSESSGFLPGAERVWTIRINGDRFCLSHLMD